MRRRDFIAGLGSGASLAAGWSGAARAQQRRMPVIGYLSAHADGPSPQLANAFRRGLGELGYVEGRNVEIVYRWAETRYERLPKMAADLVHRRVDVIAAVGGTPSVRAAKAATTTIPIVFQYGEDPVESGLVASLNRPGGNITGHTILVQEVTAKRVQLLHEFAPTVTSIGYILNPTGTNPDFEGQKREAERAARDLGVRLVAANVSTPGEIQPALAKLVDQGIGALLVDAEPLFLVERVQLDILTARYALPAIFFAREFVDAGGLMSYGADLADAYRIVGNYAGRILKGDKPADLPVQQPSKFYLVVNLKTAKALGLTVPETLLATADEVIQ